MEVLKLSQKGLKRANKQLNRGGVVIFPTDTVYGFLADATNKKAIAEIYKIKKRPRKKPLAVFVKDIKMAKELAEISKDQDEILKKSWPGKYTFILKAKIKNQYLVKNGGIALRMPRHKLLLNLLKKINKPLAQTSVNISGQPEMNKIKDIIENFKNSDVLIFDSGNLPKRKPSSIMDLTENKIKILR